jgi:nicotinamidase-related amidase
MLHLSHNATLILIDIQKAWDDPVWGHRNNQDAETHIVALLQAWRQTKRPLFHIQHISQKPDSLFQPGTPAIEIKDIVRPQNGERVIQKHAHSAFIGTDLAERLRQADIQTLIITGFMTNHCVETTARMAGDLGFQHRNV